MESTAVNSTGSKKFILVNSLVSAVVLTVLLLATLLLTFLVLPIGQLKVHLFQAGIFTAGFLFGPWIGALVGGLSSSYVALAVLNNPWVIGGNAILGFLAAYFYRKIHPIKAVMIAYLIQIPYLVLTDIYLARMPLSVVIGIVQVLFIGNLLSATVAMMVTPLIKSHLPEQKGG